jgi:hypothetical protein
MGLEEVGRPVLVIEVNATACAGFHGARKRCTANRGGEARSGAGRGMETSRRRVGA